MDKDRISGSFEQGMGSVEEAIGAVTGDTKLKIEGRSDKARGKVRSAIGGVKDAVRDLSRK